MNHSGCSRKECVTGTFRRSALRTALFLLPVLAAVMSLGSCDRMIYDRGGDCSVSYRVRFRYDYNMKWADAFGHEVECVTLYVIDSGGNVVWIGSESGSALAEEGYVMSVDVAPGRYSLLAWCGTRDKGSFDILGTRSDGDGRPEMPVPGTSRVEDLTCTMVCKWDVGQNGGVEVPYVDSDIDRLYYGYSEDVEFSPEPGIHTVTLPLVKNTNSVRVVLQHISGEPVDKDMFTFRIISDNGKMDWDNSLVGDEIMTYYAWHVDGAVSDVRETRSGAVMNTAVAQLTTGRLVKGHEARLTVTNNETGMDVLSVPLVDLALLVKGNYGKVMDDQEYLDRQDEYNLVFFLDEGNRWVSSSIYINSWRIVLQNIDI